MNIALETILTAALTLFVVQSIKLATDGIRGNFNLSNVFYSYGGMPSSHTAVVSSLCTIVAYHDGFDSISFSIAVIFSIIIIGDAMMFRGYVDRNSLALLKLLEKLPKDERERLKPLKTNLRHTFSQVVVGAMIGIGIASLVRLLY